MDVDGTLLPSAQSLPFARSYQLEALEKAIKQNTIVFLETGSGKTLIAIMLLRSYAYLIRKPSLYFAIFLVPQVVLVPQQAEAVKMHTDLKVGMYWGEMGVDFWDASKWEEEKHEHEVFVMTPQIFLNGLRHCFFRLDTIKVLIFDECHHAAGKHPYACIMTEFYHQQLRSSSSHLPRVFGMTASPINSKGSSRACDYWEKIKRLENLMNSKVYTCISESVLAEYIPFSKPKLRTYAHIDIPFNLFELLAEKLQDLKQKHIFSVRKLDLEQPVEESVLKKIVKLFSTFLFCLNELGVWMCLKAAQSFSHGEANFFVWEKLDVFGETIIRDFSKDAVDVFAACLPCGPGWSIGDNLKANMEAGFVTSKIFCLIECLLEYKDFKKLRCIIFVERVITSIVLQNLLNEVLPGLTGWEVKHIAGNNAGLHSQTRRQQNDIIDEFRKGMVNIIVATSILEEGLDVQSCNLVVRFDPSATVCSFIQSRGRARMQESDFLLMVRSGDSATLDRLKTYLACGDIMREESLRHASFFCESLEGDLYDGEYFVVEKTGALVTMSSSIGLLYFYCSRLPSDGYFKSAPVFYIDKDAGICTVNLPKSCPIRTVCVQGKNRVLKQLACLEACRQLHEIGELTDNLVPKVVVEEAASQQLDYEDLDKEHPSVFPPELVNNCYLKQKTTYYCYSIQLNPNFEYDIDVHDILLLVRSELDYDIKSFTFDLVVEMGTLAVGTKYAGLVKFSPEQVLLSRRFQTTIFRVLMDHDCSKYQEDLSRLHLGNDLIVDYLLLPSAGKHEKSVIIDWKTICSALFSTQNNLSNHVNCIFPNGYARSVQTIDGLVCSCMLEKSVVCTPHNGRLYLVDCFLEDLDGNKLLTLGDGEVCTYMEYFKSKHGIKLHFEKESLLRGRHIFTPQNYLQKCRKKKEKEKSKATVELPPEICSIIMSPISLSTFYSYTFIPSVMHRLESFLIAGTLKKMPSDHCLQKVEIATIKVLEAITTKKCQENFHLESLETLGDSFLKYAASQQLFKLNQNHHEGLLSIMKDKMVSNATLRKLGCDAKISNFIRNEPFDPKTWFIPGDHSRPHIFEEQFLSDTQKIYVTGKRKIKGKTIADVVEALIGAYLSAGGEMAALSFMNWLGIEVDFNLIPYERQYFGYPERLINIGYLQKLLNYSFRDPLLLVEALTHGSYMLAEIPGCYQRLEFLGDSVLDYLITTHLNQKFPNLSPGLLTDLRSASVNNDCYAISAVRAGLHKHILHASRDLHRHIVMAVENFEQMSLDSIFGWETNVSYPKVLGDIIESLAGAIYVDSGYNKAAVFLSIRPLLEPLVTPETLKWHPVRELNEVCQKQNYTKKKDVISAENGKASITIEIEANGVIHRHTSTEADKKTAKKVACREVLKSLKMAASADPNQM